MEWTLPHTKPDSRGNRRYFTIASSPTEDKIHIGIKVPDQPSSFKSAFQIFPKESEVVASRLSGNFVLPKDHSQKVVGIAGGIGITPFRSMAKFLIDSREKRDMVIFYACLHPDEFAYKEIFDEAKSFGVRMQYVITDSKNVPPGWQGSIGFLNKQIISTACPDFLERVFYLSGPDAMVNAYKKLLKGMGVSSTSIKVDYFPGY